MMNTLDAICSRKSVRTYTGEPISPEEEAAILKAAYAAPVGLGQYEKMSLRVIRSKTFLERIGRCGAAAFGRDDNMLYGAPEMILVSTVLDGTPADNVAYSNAACIVENMALAATELGVGACHIWGAVAAMRKIPKLVAMLQLPPNHTPCCGLILGRTTEKYAPRDIQQNRMDTLFLEE